MSDPRLIISAVLFLAFVIVTMWGTEINAGTRGGLEHGRAQAVAERRRAVSAVGTARRRVREARASGGRGMARAGRVARAARAGIGTVRAGMRGPRAGAAPGSAIPAGSGPGRRIAAAARRGAVAGARQARRGVRAATRRAPGLAGWFPGRRPRTAPRAGPGPRPRLESRRAARVAVCDSCGKFTPALQPTPVWGPDGVTEEWMLCYQCREILADPPSWPQPPSPALAAPEVSGPAGPAVSAPPAPGISTPSAPALPGSAEDLVDDPEQPYEIAEPDRVPVMAGQVTAPAPTGGTPPMASQPAVRPRSQPAAITATGGTGTDVAVTSSTTHGLWARNIEAVARALAFMILRQDAMKKNLTTVNASKDQIRDITAWSSDVTVVIAFIVAGFAALDKPIQYLIDGYQQIGGVDQGADPGHYRDI